MKLSHTSLILLIGQFLVACSGHGGVSQPAGTATAENQNKGSDKIGNQALAWAEHYQQLHPELRISVTGVSGIVALINHNVDIANAWRKTKEEEINKVKAYGVDPQEYAIARNAIALRVNPNHPIQHLTLQQISHFYSRKINNRRVAGGPDRQIIHLSREANSGAHVSFLETVFRLGKSDV